MHVPLASLSPDWRDLQVKHLVKDNHYEHMFGHIGGIENVNIDAS